MLSTPTDEKTEQLAHLCDGKIYTSGETCPKHGRLHVCRGRVYSSQEFCPRHGPKKERNERPWVSWWWWTTFELPRKQPQRGDFIIMIIAIVFAESLIGPVIGMILRSIFGWPF